MPENEVRSSRFIGSNSAMFGVRATDWYGRCEISWIVPESNAAP